MGEVYKRIDKMVNPLGGTRFLEAVKASNATAEWQKRIAEMTKPLTSTAFEAVKASNATAEWQKRIAEMTKPLMASPEIQQRVSDMAKPLLESAAWQRRVAEITKPLALSTAFEMAAATWREHVAAAAQPILDSIEWHQQFADMIGPTALRAAADAADTLITSQQWQNHFSDITATVFDASGQADAFRALSASLARDEVSESPDEHTDDSAKYLEAAFGLFIASYLLYAAAVLHADELLVQMLSDAASSGVFLLEMTDALYEHSAAVRGAIILLGVAASIVTLLRRK